MERIFAARGALLDLDGTLVAGGAALPGAVELVRRLGRRCAIVSNDAEHTPAQLAARLRRLGLAVPPGRILLAGATALDTLARERPSGRVLMLASAALRGYARRRGLRPVEEGPDIVLLGRDRAFSYARLQAAARAVRAGAALVVCNPDLTHPGPGGAVVPETGALLVALLACTGKVPVRIIGKPQPALFEAALGRLDIGPEEAVMLGDNPLTDGVGARRAGLDFLLVRPGDLAGLAALRYAA